MRVMQIKPPPKQTSYWLVVVKDVDGHHHEAWGTFDSPEAADRYREQIEREGDPSLAYTVEQLIPPEAA